MSFKVGDMANNHVYSEDMWIVTGINQRDPNLPSWVNNCVRIEFLYSRNKDGTKPFPVIRYVNPRIFEHEWVIL